MIVNVIVNVSSDLLIALEWCFNKLNGIISVVENPQNFLTVRQQQQILKMTQKILERGAAHIHI